VDDQERERRLDKLQRQLGDAEEDERTWGMKMSSLSKGTAEFSQALQKSIDAHNRARDLRREIRALGGRA
jgi:hypothetical protein